MRCLVLLCLLLVCCSAEEQRSSDGGLLGCFFEANGLACARKRMAEEVDRIEVRVTGRSEQQVPISSVIEQTGSFVADGLQALFGPEVEDSSDDDTTTGAEVQEARKKKFGKKKKKHLHKLMMIGMLVKSKLGLLMQLLSTHFQIKFFAIAIISLFINIARFWIDLKKIHRPQKVIYYEHAQHQHHYDHDDDHGLWGRSSDESTPQEIAYSSYNPERQP